MIERAIDLMMKYNFVELRLQGEIPDEEDSFIIPFLPRRKKMTVWDLEKLLIGVSENPNVAGVLIKIGSLKIGLARAETIRRVILELREKGKKVFAYLEGGDNIEYLIASAADYIVVPPWAILNLLGLSAEVTFFRDALYKLGIEAQIKGLGEYKSAVETFTRSDMSEPHKEMVNSIIDDLFSQFIKYVSEGRGIDEKKLKALIDSAPFTAQEALAHGLVNELGYETDLEKSIEEILSTKIRKISSTGLLRVMTVRDLLRLIDERIRGRAGIIALICDSGIITQGESRGSGGGPKTIGSQTLTKMLGRLADDPGVKAIVLRLSSPGGSGIASDSVRNQIKAISQKKPVIVSMSDVAASGGYMIALGARKIVANPLTLTGSIGIISGKFNMENLLKKLGIYKEWVKRGKRALIYSSYRAFTKDEEQKIGSIMKSLYDDFVGKVAQVRDMDFKDAEQLARGRVWTGRQAKELGLVDELGGIKTAINLAKREAGISGHLTPVIRLYSKPKYIQVSPFGKFFSLGEQLDSLVDGLLTLKREKILAMMPFWIDFK